MIAIKTHPQLELHEIFLCIFLSIERFSIEHHKAETKVITLTHHQRHRQSNQPTNQNLKQIH